MRFFSLGDFQYWVLAFFLGVVGLILVYIAWGTYPLYREHTSEEEMRLLEGHEISEGHDMEKNPIAPFLIFIYVGSIIWSIVYVVMVGIMRTTSF